MTPERFRQIRNLFEAALEKEPDARRALIGQAAGSDAELQNEVLRMLQAHERKVAFLDGGLTAPAELRTDPRRMEGRRLGSFEILREIGRGGMGTVYLARRADELFEQQVAIKVVMPQAGGADIIHRFNQERAILAALDHPHIARLYDGGTTEEGWPYFVMEYVKGQPIDVWCDEQRLNTSARLRLFGAVCEAVHYAHQHGVIHRDLKPGNILVTGDGVVKLLDFGIAKLVRSDEKNLTLVATRTGALLMTPEYASPEQVLASDITPRSDIYSLGVILYELLTGRRPYRLKTRVLQEVVRAVCEQSPPRPSAVVTADYVQVLSEGKSLNLAPGLLSQTREGTPVDLRRRLSGDLDDIVFKTLEKDPLQRYRSAEQLKTDLERHLNGQPILASHAGRFGRLAQFIGRYKLPLAIGAGFVAALATGALHVEWRGVAYIAAAIAFLGLWYVATNRRVGSFVNDYIYGSWSVVIVLAMFVTGAALYYGSGISAGGLAWFATAFLSSATLFMLCMLISWPLRGRWAGELVYRGKSAGRTQGLLLAATANFINPLAQIYRGVRAGEDDVTMAILYIAFLVSLLLYGFLVVGRIEVRGRGVIAGGRLIPWVKVQSFAWESPSEIQGLFSARRFAEFEYLKLNVRRSLKLLPPFHRVPISAGDVEPVNTIVEKHLAAWPQ
jgi:serine/threonine protein kinase